MSSDILECSNVRVSFGGVTAVDGVSFAVARASVVGLVGPNGSGKSTLLNAVGGVVPATGVVRVDGRNLRLCRPRALRAAGLVRVYQSPQLCADLNCLDNVLMGDVATRGLGLTGAWAMRPAMVGRERTRRDRAGSALERVGLDGYETRPANALTYGEQRLLELARAIMGDPVVLLLDEPSAGLNDQETTGLGRLLADIRADGVTVVVVDHKIDFIDALCDRILVLESGRLIADGEPAQVWSDSRVIDAYLGVARDA